MIFSLFQFSIKKCIVFVATLLFALSFFFSNSQSVFASIPIDMNNSNSIVVEHLRLKVSRQNKDAWLTAEKKSWEPWLKEQKGFLGRQLFWDPDNEEATIFISWASREDWKSIPQRKIDDVQELFEKIAIDSIGKDLRDPFPLNFQGQLLPQ